MKNEECVSMHANFSKMNKLLFHLVVSTPLKILKNMYIKSSKINNQKYIY